MAINIDESVTAQFEAELGMAILKIWTENCKDVFIMELVCELFVSLASNTKIVNAFQTRMFPILIESLKLENGVSDFILVASSLDLLICLIKNVHDPLPEVYITQMFPVVMQLLLQATDSGILQNGQELLKALVNRDFNGILNLKHQGRSGLDVLLEFVANMLQCESESSTIFLGGLISKLIQKGGEHLVPYLPQLLTAVIFRLDKAKMTGFIETLVLIFCSLIETQCPVVIEFLAGIQLEGGYTGLELFVRAFCDCFNDLQGVYTVKLGTLAMMLFLSSGDQRLESIMVKGDLIIPKTSSLKN